MEDALYSAKSFGNWIAKLVRNEVTMELVKDRNQFSVVGPSNDELKAMGLWRAFDDFEEFSAAVLKVFGSDRQVG